MRKVSDPKSIVFLAILLITAIIVSLSVALGLYAQCRVVPPESGAKHVTPTSIWRALLEKTPLAYTTPQPAPIDTPLDGTYTKIDLSRPQAWLCRRCADYRPAGGIWKLQFEQGVMRIFYEVTGWRSIASFTVSGNRLVLFNDPYCPEDVGEYTWFQEGEDLSLNVIDDPCSIRLRGENLNAQPWTSCFPSNGERESPIGCEETIPIPPTPSHTNLQVSVAVQGGDNRLFEDPPDIIVPANSEDNPTPGGINITSSHESIPYGLSRILWWEGDWIEVSTELPFDSIGVQFLGDPQIGWGRVIFDEVEVWRGNTSEIWSNLGRHGGYIEISSFRPGVHTMRVEALGFDYRPVTVAGFGFRFRDDVEREQP